MKESFFITTPPVKLVKKTLFEQFDIRDQYIIKIIIAQAQIY